jgi:DNA-binding LacI/PurR family transcriptional regulator
MRYANKQAKAQGELLFKEVDKLPEGWTPVKAECGQYIIGHSETGHHHIIREQEGVTVYVNDNEPNHLFLVVDNTAKGDAVLEHLRDHDTHKPFAFAKPQGKKEKQRVYRIRRQIESAPQGFQRALD